jgi:hypothetical protein
VVAFPRRTLLARRSGLSSVERVYRTRDAIEVEELEGYDVTRRRVLFDEVMLVTRHKEVGWGFVLAMMALLTFTGFMTLVVGVVDPKSGVLTGLFFVLPFVVLVALRLILRVDIITVQGPRSRARIPFWFQKERANEVFRLVARLAREHQQRRARAQEKTAVSPEPGPPSGTPPPPPPVAPS